MHSEAVLKVYSSYLKQEIDDDAALSFVSTSLERGDAKSAYFISRMLYARASSATRRQLTEVLMRAGRQDLVPLDQKLAYRRGVL